MVWNGKMRIIRSTEPGLNRGLLDPPAELSRVQRRGPFVNVDNGHVCRIDERWSGCSRRIAATRKRLFRERFTVSWMRSDVVSRCQIRSNRTDFSRALKQTRFDAGTNENEINVVSTIATCTIAVPLVTGWFAPSAVPDSAIAIPRTIKLKNRHSVDEPVVRPNSGRAPRTRPLGSGAATCRLGIRFENRRRTSSPSLAHYLWRSRHHANDTP